MNPLILIFAGIGLIAAGYDSLSEKLTKPKPQPKHIDTDSTLPSVKTGETVEHDAKADNPEHSA